MVDIKNKIIFIHIPKTAGSSVEKAIADVISYRPRFGDPHRISIRNRPRVQKTTKHGMHSTLLHLKEEDGINLEEYSSFTVVRNPWDRDYSFYRFAFVDVQAVEEGAPVPTFKEYLLAIQSLKETGKTDEIQKFKQDWSPWVKAPVTKKSRKRPRRRFTRKGKVEPHIFGNQCEYLKVNGAIGVDSIIRFENLQEDYDKFCKAKKLPYPPLPHENKGLYHTALNGPTTYKDAYTSELKELVAEVRKEDIEAFGYSF